MLTPSQALAQLTDIGKTGIDHLVDGWASGLLTGEAFADRLGVLLEEGHALAVVIGRHHAGDKAPMEEDDKTFAQTVMDDEANYLSFFSSEIASGKYGTAEEDPKKEELRRRAYLYLGRYRGTANEAFVLASPADSQWNWVLSETEAEVHCPDCPELADGSPYTTETLPTYPGANDTSCLFACLCEIKRSDGQAGFPRVKEARLVLERGTMRGFGQKGAGEDDGHWVTIHGHPVFIGGSGDSTGSGSHPQAGTGGTDQEGEPTASVGHSKEASKARKALIAEQKRREKEYKPLKKALDELAEKEFIAKRGGHKEEAERLHSEWEAQAKACKDYKDETNAALRKHLEVETPAKPAVQIRGGVPIEQAKEIDAAAEQFSRFVGTGTVDGKTLPVRITDPEGGGLSRGGSYFDPTDGHVYLEPGDGPKIVIHEMGHWLETHDPKIHEKALAFLERRTKGEEAKPLNDLFPHLEFADHEVSKPDHFLDAYMGKIYEDEVMGHYATEIVSMGLELAYQNPAKLALKDPDLFDFLHDTLRGR